jgi:tetratricopeptide (TPR) repeat protein
MNSAWGESAKRAAKGVPGFLQLRQGPPPTLFQQIQAAVKAGNYLQVEALYREAVRRDSISAGPDAPVTFAARFGHHMALLTLDRAEAETGARAALDRCQSLFGADHETTLNARQGLAEVIMNAYPLESERIAALASADSVAAFGRRSAIALRGRVVHAMALAIMGRFHESLTACNEVDAALDTFTRPDTALRDRILRARTSALFSAGRYPEALDLVAQRAQALMQAYGTDHPMFHARRLFHARLMIEFGDPHTAEAEARQAADVFARYYGSPNSQNLIAHSVESRALRAIGRLDEAVDAARYAHDCLLAIWGRPHPYVLGAGLTLAGALVERGRANEALSLTSALAAPAVQALGPDHHLSLSIRFVAAKATAARGDTGQARALHTAVLADRTRVLGSEHPRTKASEKALSETA